MTTKISLSFKSDHPISDEQIALIEAIASVSLWRHRFPNALAWDRLSGQPVKITGISKNKIYLVVEILARPGVPTLRILRELRPLSTLEALAHQSG